MSHYSHRHPEEFERKPFIPSPDFDYDLPDAPKCCGVPMCWEGGNEYYCDECGKEVSQ